MVTLTALWWCISPVYGNVDRYANLGYRMEGYSSIF